ncbi:DUF726 domain-containing protein [Micromonospora sp. NPDC126480]|uniref:DUF726 domain-containing protein n=1 Tax=Micromonospora sp. NPDC126480 TaxID=3155312 RepID=UPI00332ECAE3
MTDASFVLTTRWQARGGRTRLAVQEEVRPDHARPWLIFIHGHNVDRAYALEQWRVLRRTLHVPAQLQVGLFLWPSDLWRNRTMSKLAYPAVTERAANVGRILASYLGPRNDRVILIGHSLGALVAVNAARELLPERQPLQAFVLLGAAIAVDDMTWPGEFHRVPLAGREAVGFCPEDRVLRSVFRPGQRFARLFRRASEAVGLHGEPREARDWLARRTRVSDHSYWRSEESAALVSEVLTAPPTGRAPDSWTLRDWPVPGWDVPG